VRRLLISLMFAAALVPAVVQAAEPPNQNDPCSRGGRDSCSTTGVGEYKTYRFGLRWFGDYRGAIAGVDGAAFCLDLRFWYPGKAYDYELATGELRNRDGDRISPESLRRMNYAMYNYGRTNRKVSQGAVMLYVHRLMGDGAPGEVDRSAGGPAIRETLARIERAAERFAGPYRVELKLPKSLPVRRKAALEVRVLTASGRVVPNAQVTLASTGANGLPTKLDTGDDGVAKPTFEPRDAKTGVRVTASSGQLAASRPKLYVPARRDAARNGQRLAVPASAAVTATASADVRPAQLTVTTAATPVTVLSAQQNRDKVTIGGAYAGWRGKVEVRLYGPARSQAAISCAGPPLATTSYETGAGVSMTPPLAPAAPGWYGYQLVIASTDDVTGVTTPCPVPAESFKVETQPIVVTRVSSQTALAGSAITDTVDVTGLAGETVTVGASLFGPYAAADKMTCAAPPFWTSSFVAAADGTYVTDPVTLTVPGYYTYREAIAASDFVRAVETPCAAESETTIVRGKPQIRTQVSAQEAAPGAAITDSVVVTGLGALSATVEVALYGPFPSRAEIRCDVAPAATSQIAAVGDGTYTSVPTTLTKAGYYTYRESIAATNAFDGAATACGEVTETTFVRAKPEVTTVVSNAVVRPGSSISDRIKVTGLGQTPATVEVRLFGPFASRAAMDCSGAPLWKGTVAVAGDGETDAAKVKLSRAGFYTYRERIVGTASVAPVETACGEEVETALASPLILTGRGDRVVRAAAPPPARPASSSTALTPFAAKASTVTPTRVRVASRGIDARVYSVDIDTRSGALAIPKDIDRVGWWRDGAAPGSANGAILLAGHIDSAKQGAGAFYSMKNARRGDTVSVTSDDGKVRNYRITTMLRVRKAALPASIYSRTGRRRLVLVTCGGPFNTANGHYRDNLIVTALPR
jgi:Sortase domain